MKTFFTKIKKYFTHTTCHECQKEITKKEVYTLIFSETEYCKPCYQNLKREIKEQREKEKYEQMVREEVLRLQAKEEARHRLSNSPYRA